MTAIPQPPGAVAEPAVAYFSMEVAVSDAIPTFSGGLGVLAGDHLRAAADLGMPVVGVTLCYRDGYFHQRLDGDGRQIEEAVPWVPGDRLERVDARPVITVSGRPVHLRVWRVRIAGVSGHVVPLYFLDTDVEDNDGSDRAITDRLYGGDARHRLRQEAVLGMGGMALLQALGWGAVPTCHMNEGHSALLALALRTATGGADPDAVRARGVFTTHTPVPAGHDRFPQHLVREVLGDEATGELGALGGLVDGELNMTRLGMACSRYVNAVSLRHREVCQAMFPDVPVGAITNGVHAGTWVAPSMADLLDRHVPGWRQDNAGLRYCSALPLDELEAAHATAKRAMIGVVADRAGVTLSPEVLTLGAARRAAGYKRIDLLLRDPERLAAIVERAGPLQIVYSGKAHPQDGEGKAVIERVFATARDLEHRVRIAYVPDYSMSVARALVAGVDVWVNTPERPLEASGTSGMKAALNGVPNLSVLDGWWIEGHVEGVTGWSVGGLTGQRDDPGDAESLYAKLESAIAPRYYAPGGLGAVRRSAVSLVGSWFTTERMVREYAAFAYGWRGVSRPAGGTGTDGAPGDGGSRGAARPAPGAQRHR